MSENQQLDVVFINQIMYYLHLREKTASIFDGQKAKSDIIIPRSINYKTNEYIITVISEGAFKSSKIKSIQFPSDSEIRTIEKHAFLNSTIESITIPSKLTDLKDGWCEGTENLHKIIINSDNPRYKIYEDKFIIGKKSIESENFDVLVFCIRDVEQVTIPNFIKCIGPLSFNKCKKLAQIDFQSNSELLTIEKGAFSEVPIKTIAIPPSVVDLKDGCPNNPRYSFFDEKFIIGKSSIDSQNYNILVFCVRNIVKVTIPCFIEHIGAFAFEKCRQLSDVEIPKNSNLLTIEESAFSESAIESFTIPHQLTKIGENAFYKCRLFDFEIPKNSKLLTIGNGAFFKAKISQFIIPPQLTVIGDSAFEGCLDLEEVKIPNNSQLITIGEKAFYETNIKEFTIPSKVKQIGYAAFLGCSQCQKIEIPKDSQLQIIENYAFKGLPITNFTVPIHVTKIGDCAFEDCFQLRTIDISVDSELETIGNCSFFNTDIESITIPSKTVNLEIEWCNSLTLLTEVIVGPDNPRYKMIDDELLIGKSQIESDCFDVLVFGVRNIGKLIVPSFIKEISPFAFNNCIFLHTINIQPNSELNAILDDSFSYTDIEKIAFPPHLKTINGNAFYHCKKLKYIDFPVNSELELIDETAFVKTSITSFIFPSNLIRCDESAFGACYSLQIVQIDKNPNLFGIFDEIFSDCPQVLIMIPADFYY